ncbi:MAG TPA: energy transducer TonB [Flavobacteriales bacterium]|nr:energy transducer TonB [Flavobacteriales bacterium]
MPRAIALSVFLLPLFLLAQSSLDELRGASDKAQGVHDRSANETSAQTDTSVFESCEIPIVAMYPGGQEAMMEFLRKNTHYPQEAREARIEGKVYVQFIVEKDGSLSDVHSLRTSTGSLTAEAIRVVRSMPRWTPGMQRGKPVRSRFKLPINFTLDNASPPKK